MRQVQIESPFYRRVNSGLSNQSKVTQLVSGDTSPGNLALEFVLICTLYLFIFRNIIKVNHCNGAVELQEKWLRKRLGHFWALITLGPLVFKDLFLSI